MENEGQGEARKEKKKEEESGINLGRTNELGIALWIDDPTPLSSSE